ncbi:MAG: AAA family ATPase [Patescibacteria group bacterium]|nr:AAA family ATPase [Patescibacteria group bacterium]
MPKIIIGLTGEIGAGKDTVANYLVEKHHATVHKFSTAMFDCLHRLDVTTTRENLATFSVITRQSYGEDLYARIVARDCGHDPSAIVVANGIRRPADMVHLKKLPGFRLVFVSAPERLRFERIRNRGEKENEKNMSWEEFAANEKLPTEAAIHEISDEADVRLDNAGDLTALYAQVDRLLQSSGA